MSPTEFDCVRIFEEAIRLAIAVHDEVPCYQVAGTYGPLMHPDGLAACALRINGVLNPNASIFPGMPPESGWLADVDTVTKPAVRNGIKAIGLALADLCGETKFYSQGRRLLKDGLSDLWWGMERHEREQCRARITRLPKAWTWDQFPLETSSAPTRQLSPLGLHPMLLPSWATVSYGSYFEMMGPIGAANDVSQVSEQLCRIRVVLNATFPYFELDGNPLPAKNENAARFVKMLIAAGGNWIESNKIADIDSILSGVRIDRLWKTGLLDEIRQFVESSKGMGYRLLPTAWHSNANNHP